MTRISGRNLINGKHGRLFWDGELILEAESFEARAIANREEVNFLGSTDVDSKLLNVEGEGTLTLKRVYSRGMRKFIEAWQQGIDPRSTITGVLDDPDTVDGQAERVTINNIWFNEMVIMEFEAGEVIENEYPFGFTVSDVDIQETID